MTAWLGEFWVGSALGLPVVFGCHQFFQLAAVEEEASAIGALIHDYTITFVRRHFALTFWAD